MMDSLPKVKPEEIGLIEGHASDCPTIIISNFIDKKFSSSGLFSELFNSVWIKLYPNTKYNGAESNHEIADTYNYLARLALSSSSKVEFIDRARN